MNDDILNQVRAIAAEQMAIAVTAVHAKSQFLTDLGADSLDLVEMVMAMEDRFDIEISGEDTELLGNVEDAVRLIEHLVRVRPSTPKAKGPSRA